MDYINVIGAGLAGCEAAWQIAKRGIKVKLYEMKPCDKTPAHKADTFAELVCSNSLKSNLLENAAGLLKEEMRLLDSIIIKTADSCKVPAGGALAVDRELFSRKVDKIIKENDNIEVIEKKVTDIPSDAVTIIATGPLTDGELFESIKKITGREYLHFFDAAAPLVYYDTIDMEKAYSQARYNKGEGDYINCPLDKNEYEIFYEALINAEKSDIKEVDKKVHFEGCMPIEELALRGKDTIRYGPMKPKGLINPRTDRQDYAVLQLRQDNSSATLYNLVGFQTSLKWGEQKRVFSLIPALKNADYARYGVMHRNTFINSPGLIDATFNMIKKPEIYFAGQITGVEGYIESAASGLVAGLNAAMRHIGKSPVIFPAFTAIGALPHYITSFTGKNFQPMNINFGIMDIIPEKTRDKRQRYSGGVKRAVEYVRDMGI